MSLTRRSFLKTSGAAASGLVLGFYVLPKGPRGAVLQAAEAFAPNAFVRITPDDLITVIVNKSEMGQGVYTSMPMLIAEELDANWETIQIEPAPAAPEYADPDYGMQVTGGELEHPVLLAELPERWRDSTLAPRRSRRAEMGRRQGRAPYRGRPRHPR